MLPLLRPSSFHLHSATLLAFVAASTAMGGIIGFSSTLAVYDIDLVTGNVTQVGNAVAYGATTSSMAGQFYITTLPNLRLYNPSANTNTYIGKIVGNVGGDPFFPIGAEDLAFDTSTGALYDSIRGELWGLPTFCGGGGAPVCPGLHIASLGNIRGIDFVPGSGLYGVDTGLFPSLWQIDPATGARTLVGFTGPLLVGYSVLDLAFDAPSNSFLASAVVGPINYGSLPPTGIIFRIDRGTGVATLLNPNAPVMLGMAENVPEPSTSVPSLIAGALLVAGYVRRQPVLR